MPTNIKRLVAKRQPELAQEFLKKPPEELTAAEITGILEAPIYEAGYVLPRAIHIIKHFALGESSKLICYLMGGIQSWKNEVICEEAKNFIFDSLLKYFDRVLSTITLVINPTRSTNSDSLLPFQLVSNHNRDRLLSSAAHVKLFSDDALRGKKILRRFYENNQEGLIQLIDFVFICNLHLAKRIEWNYSHVLEYELINSFIKVDLEGIWKKVSEPITKQFPEYYVKELEKFVSTGTA